MNEFSILIEAFIRKKQEAKGVDYCPVIWLDSASERASHISVVTHVVKFANGDAKGTNIYVKAVPSEARYFFPYVTTDSLNNCTDDIVATNAAHMDIPGFLQLVVNGLTILDLVAKDDTSFLTPFAENQEILLRWMQGFKSVLLNNQLSSHTLAKQVYFPTENGNYHLLAPLHASSLSHVLYDRIQEEKFGEKAKQARDSKKTEKYSDTIIVHYPELAVQIFGGAKPHNISSLNAIRKGKSYLLRNAPPLWKSIGKPPMNKHGFWRDFDRRAASELNAFKQFLISVPKRENNKEIRDQRRSHIRGLIDILISLASEIQAMPPSWSLESEIPLHEKIWLDPFCEDNDVKRSEELWKESISNRFARFVTGKLKKEFKNLGDTHHEYLSGMFLELLKEIER